MERIYLLLVVLLGVVVPQVWCQTPIPITKVDVTLTGGSDTYIEADTHTFVFDVDITIGPGAAGADDAAIDRWQLVVSMLDKDGNAIAGGVSTKTLIRGDGLTPAQADLTISAGSTGTMRGVEVEFDTAGFTDPLCPDPGPDEDMWHTLEVKLEASTTYAVDHVLSDGDGNSPVTLKDDVSPQLPCRGAVISLVPHIVSGLPIIENTLHEFTIDIIATSDAGGRSVEGPDGIQLWDLKFTLETATGDEIEITEQVQAVGATDVGYTVHDLDPETENLESSDSISFSGVKVRLDLMGAATNGGTDPGTVTTCDEFDKFCVTLSRDDGGDAMTPMFTFRGSAEVNSNGNPKKCVTIAKPDHCNGILITDVAVGLAGTEKLCQGTDEMENTMQNEITLTMTVHLDEKSAPLVVANIAGTGTNTWAANVFGSSNADCSEPLVPAKTSLFDGGAAFNDLQPGSDNTFPTLTVEFDLTGVGCQQVQYICVQLLRNEAIVTNADFTYEFLRPGVTSANEPILDTPPGTNPLSSQWGVTEIDCQGVEMMGTMVTLDGGFQTLGEYTRSHKLDFKADFTEASAGCWVQGDDLWTLKAYLSVDKDSSGAPNGATAAAKMYPLVEETEVIINPGREDQDVTAAAGVIEFADSRLEFDLSDLDCQQGPFYLCVRLEKNPDADKDFVLEDADDDSKYIQCTAAPVPCVGVQLLETTLSQAETPSNNYFPLRQGLDDIEYLIDVNVESNELYGSILPNPETAFISENARAERIGDDLWDFDVFLAEDNLGNMKVTGESQTGLHDCCGLEIEDLELQAGSSATFESVRVPMKLGNVQCHEFSYLCVTVKHGATHEQDGEVYPADAANIMKGRAPTLEPISTTLDNDVTCPATTDGCVADMDFVCLAAPDFCAYPSQRPMSANTHCIEVECRGVEIDAISCEIETGTPTGVTSDILDGDIQEGDEGIFHLSIDIDTNGNAGGVNGDNLWKLTVFLSPDETGETVTIERPVKQRTTQLADTHDTWEDTDVTPGSAMTLDVWTDETDPFKLDYPCEEIRYLCVKFEKGYDTADTIESPPDYAAILAGDGDTDFSLEPNPFISCKVLDSCGGVILDDVLLALNNPELKLIEKQDSTTLTGVNQLKVDVDLVFNEKSATFDDGTDFWDVDLFVAENDVGTEGVVAAKDGVFEQIDGAVVVNGVEEADRTTSVHLDNSDPIDPEFDLTGVTCKDGDTDDSYLYLCVRVSKHDDSPIDFSLTPEQRTKCIKVTCEGVVFATPILHEVSGGPILEVTSSNELKVSVEFPIVDNGAAIANDYPTDLWSLIIFLSGNEDGQGEKIAWFKPELSEAEKRDGVTSTSSLKFNDKDAVLSMVNKLCSGGEMYICAQLNERDDAEPDCSIDTSAAVVCQEMMCKGVVTTTLDFTTLPEDACLVEHKKNSITFDLVAETAPETASVSGTNLWLVTVYGSVAPNGEGTRFGQTLGILDESTSLTSGDPFELDDVLAEVNLDHFVCPNEPYEQMYLCVELDRNTEQADPIFTLTKNPERKCEEIKCKGVKINALQFTGPDPVDLIERSGPTRVVSDLRITTDRDYASIEGENLWTITGELRDDEEDVVVLSVEADLTDAQRDQGLTAGDTTTFNDIAVEFDLDRNIPCPASGSFQFCLIIAKGDQAELNPDFSIDEESETEVCETLTCRGVCVEASTATAVGGEPLQEGDNEHDVYIDASFYSDPEYAGIIESDARNLWKVNVFASATSNGQNRWAETEGELDTNNQNYPLAAGGVLQLSNIHAKLDFNGDLNGEYLTCNDIRYICVELVRGDDPSPEFSLFGCPSTRLVSCVHFECQGVVLEEVTLQLNTDNGALKENTEEYEVLFNLVLTPHSTTSLLPEGNGPSVNHWRVELFGSNEDVSENPTAERNALTQANIPDSELSDGIQVPGPGVPDTTLAGLSATMDLSNEYCGGLEYLCARVLRGSGADPAFTLSGVPDDYALIGCTKVMCEGVDIESAEFQDVDPMVIAEGNPSWIFEYDVTFETHAEGGGVFGSNLWRLATFLAETADGTGVLDMNDDDSGDVIYPILSGGAQSQTLVPGEELGFQSVRGTFDTRGLTCPNEKVFFCVRLEKDEALSSSEFTLNSPAEDRQVCEEVDCKGVELMELDFTSDRTIITEREPDQNFVLDIRASTNDNSGSVSGTDLWSVTVFFNSEEDGDGDDFGTKIEAKLEPDNANRAVSAGNLLLLNDVSVDVSAANVLCGEEQMYLCVSLTKGAESDPNFSLIPDEITTCKEVTCNPVIITNADCKVNSPEYLLENIINTLNFEVRLTSASVSAAIDGDDLWSLDHVFTNNMENGEGDIAAESKYEILSESQQGRDLTGGNSLILSDINAHLDLTGAQITCDDIEYLCVEFGKNDDASPDFTLSFQGDATPPWCKEIECRGVEAKKTELNIDTASVEERTSDNDILFDVTLYTDPGAAGVAGDNLWVIKTKFTDSEYNQVENSVVQTVPLGVDDRSLLAGIPLEFPNLLAENVNLQNVICPEDGLFFCVYIEKNPATSNDFTLSEGDDSPGALHDCQPINCEGVQFTETSITIDNGDEISENAPSANHIINFQFEATSSITTAIATGSDLWDINIFGSRNEDGSGSRYLADTLELSDSQKNQDLQNGGQFLPFSNLVATLDMRGVRCVDFRYFCAEIARNPDSTPNAFSLQGINEDGEHDDDVLIACQEMDCVGAYITTFDATSATPLILLENTDDQDFTLDASLESDPEQESVTGANLWAMKAFFNPLEDCQGLDDDGEQIRIAESDVTFFGGDDDQSLIAGSSINFNDLRVHFDYDGTCEELEPEAYFCLEVIRSPTATPTFTLLGNTLKGMHAECRGVEVTGTTITAASWTPSVFVERSGGSRKRQTETLVFDLDVLVSTDINAAGVDGSDLWQVAVYLSGDEECKTWWRNDTYVIADLSSVEENQNLVAGGPLSFNIDGVAIDVEHVLCENARYVCAQIQQKENPSNDFTVRGVPDEGALVGSWPLDCRGVRIVESHLTEISAGLPLISGEQNHQIVFSFTINTDDEGAGVTGTNLFTLNVYGNNQPDGFGEVPGNGQASYPLPISRNVMVQQGVPNSFDFLPARLNLEGVSCDEIPYVCVQIYKGAASDPNYTLQPDDANDPVFTDCIEVPCAGVVIDELELEFQSGLPLLEDADDHQLNFFIVPHASQYGGDAIGTGLWAAKIFISANPDGSGPQYAVKDVNIVNPDETLIRGTSIDILSNVRLDLTGIVCLNVQYICVDLLEGPNAEPDITLEGVTRSCQGFTCKGVEFSNPTLHVDDGVNFKMLTANTHVEFDATIDATVNSASVSGYNLFKVSVFASTNPDGTGERYGENYAVVANHSDIVAGGRTHLSNVQAYLNFGDVRCNVLKFLCIEIWQSEYANPYYQIDVPENKDGLRVCQPVSCNGVWIDEVTPEIQLGSPLIENSANRNTWIDIHVEPSFYSASIVGDNLWKATCFANSQPDGSGVRYSLQNAILQPSEVNKDYVHSYEASDYLILENAVVQMDYSGRHCNEIEYICCTIGENDNAEPDFVLEGTHGYDHLLTGCSHVDCLGVGVTSTRLSLDNLEILKGDDSHSFVGDIAFSIWRESRAIQRDNTWKLHAAVIDNDGNEVAMAPVELIQEQQDRGVIPGTDITFEDIRFEVDLSNKECYQIAYVCVYIETQPGVDFTLAGVTDSGESNDDALVGCSPHLQCADFDVDIEVTDVGERHIELQWTEGGGDFDTYVITYAPEEQIVESPQYIPRNLRAPLRFDGLTPGQEYTFNLYLYKGGSIKSGPVREIERTKPATVDVTINRQTNSELHVQWSEADGVYDTYIVELYPQGTPPTPIYVDALAPREQIFSGLREARVYTVTIYTVVGGRNGYRSSPGYASETTRPAPPYLELDDSPPSTDHIGTHHVDLTWIAPSGYLVAGYKLVSEPDEPATNLPQELGPDLDSYRVTGLTPGRQYTFHLQAFADVEGAKIYSEDDSVQARTYPESVHEIDVEESTTTSITIEWEEPPGDIDSYLISYPEQAGEPQRISALLPRRFTAHGLSLATHYEFTIISVSGGLESKPYTFAASTRPNNPGPVQPISVDTDEITIGWDAAPGPRDGYEVSYSPNHPNYLPPSPFFTADEEFTLTGLHPHTTIDFEVRTVSEGARSEPSYWRQRTYPDLPGAVEDFRVSVSSPNSVMLSFSQPDYPNGLITAYIVRYEGTKPGVLGVDSGLQTITALPNDHDFETELLGLRSGYTYTFEIQAANSEGSGTPVSFDGVTLVPGLPILLISNPEELRSYFSKISPSAYGIDNVPVYKGFFSDANGDIIGYTVLVVEDKASNFTPPAHPLSYRQVRDRDVWPVWQTSDIFSLDDGFFRKKRQAGIPVSHIYYEVGSEDDCDVKPGYCNGPLRPLTTYRVAVRAYTEAGSVETPWSHPVTTKADQWWFAYAAIPFLIIVLTLAIILALCACMAGEKKVDRRRKYRNDYQKDDFTDYGAEVYNENTNANANTVYMISNTADNSIPGPGTLQNSKLNPTHVLGTRPVQISKFKTHVTSMASNSAGKFVEEYENLRPVGDDLARLIGGLPENKDKNRFSNILPYDYNRVQLSQDRYINASFIGGFNSRHEYIATQGPVAHSTEDFWHMVWENNCPTIVMMGRCIEDGHVKCEQYWPESDKTVTYGNLSITMVTENVGEEWTIRDFTVQSGSEIRAVRQFNFTAWPNHGVPQQTDGVVRFVSTVRAEAPQHSGPMVIHCGAGIGRTSIFLALDILMQGLVYDETTVDVYGTVSSLRKQRCCMVQTVHQYIFLHKAMLDILQGKATGYNWLLKTRNGSIASRDSDQFTSDTL